MDFATFINICPSSVPEVNWMNNTDHCLIVLLEARAQRRVGVLAAELVTTPSEGREAVLAELQYHQWLAEACQDCL
jgi:hypothetical protein